MHKLSFSEMLRFTSGRCVCESMCIIEFGTVDYLLPRKTNTLDTNYQFAKSKQFVVLCI